MLLGTTRVAFADLFVVAKTRDRRSVPDGFVGIVRGHALESKFRIEAGAVGAVTVSPPQAITRQSQQFTAAAADLSGNPISCPAFEWSSSDETVATVTDW